MESSGRALVKHLTFIELKSSRPLTKKGSDSKRNSDLDLLIMSGVKKVNHGLSCLLGLTAAFRVLSFQ